MRAGYCNSQGMGASFRSALDFAGVDRVVNRVYSLEDKPFYLVGVSSSLRRRWPLPPCKCAVAHLK